MILKPATSTALEACEPSVEGAWYGIRRSQGMCPLNGKADFIANFSAAPFQESNLYGSLTSGPNEPSSVTGCQNGAVIRFSETLACAPASAATSPAALEFVGLLSDDGTVMRGSWRSLSGYSLEAAAASGLWTATREPPHPGAQVK